MGPVVRRNYFRRVYINNTFLITCVGKSFWIRQALRNRSIVFDVQYQRIILLVPDKKQAPYKKLHCQIAHICRDAIVEIHSGIPVINDLNIQSTEPTIIIIEDMMQVLKSIMQR